MWQGMGHNWQAAIQADCALKGRAEVLDIRWIAFVVCDAMSERTPSVCGIMFFKIKREKKMHKAELPGRRRAHRFFKVSLTRPQMDQLYEKKIKSFHWFHALELPCIWKFLKVPSDMHELVTQRFGKQRLKSFRNNHRGGFMQRRVR